jgi:glutathione S-transferase
MPPRPRPIRLYESSIPSGNVYKIALLMALLGIRCETATLDVMATPSETRRPAFLSKNPNGRIPLLELDDGSFLAESGAILYYLAQGTAYLPEEALERARVLQWMFFEQYSHEPYIAVMKFWTFWGGLHKKTPQELATLKDRGQSALAVMDKHLEGRDFFVGDGLTIADIALYAYTHTAHLTGFDLGAVPSVRRWLERVRGAPGHVPIAAGPGAPDYDATRE